MRRCLPRRILCVSNHKALSPHFLSQLEKEVDLVSAATAAEGYALAQAQHFDLFLFSDRLLTGSGIELYKKIRSDDERTPAILLLSDVRECQAVKARGARPRFVLSAPLDSDLLLETIRGLLANTERAKGLLRRKLSDIEPRAENCAKFALPASASFS
jgi:DNA-binding NarL/FixJ family response regulator